MSEPSTSANQDLDTTSTKATRSVGRADARANRQRVLDAAREIIAEQGEAAEIKDIAERAGVGVATIYRGFGSKNELLAASAFEAAGRLSELLAEAEKQADPARGLHDFLKSAVEFVGVFGWLVQNCLADETLMTLLPETKGGSPLNGIQRLVQRGLDSGALSKSIPVDMSVLVIKSALLSLTYSSPSEPKPEPSRVADRILEMIEPAVEAL